MRTTLTIDDDVLATARAIAQRDRRPIGEVVSELARRGMTPAEPALARRETMGFRAFAPRGGRVTTEIVDELLDEAP